MLGSEAVRLLLLSLCVVSAVYAQDGAAVRQHRKKAVVCYWSSQSWKRPAPYNYSVQDIPAEQCSHLVYSSANIDTKTYNLTFQGSTVGANESVFDSAVGLKRKNPSLILLLRVGDCHHGYDPIASVLANSSEGRSAFAKSAFDWIVKHHFDGIALGWCKPKDNERANLVKVVKEVRKELSKVNRKTYILLEVPVDKKSLRTGYNVTELARYVDYFHARTYSLRGSWVNYTDVHSPLQKRPFEGNDLTDLNVKDGAQLLVKLGAPSQKILLGIPFFGTSYTLANATNHGLQAALRDKSPSGRPGQYTNHTGILAYFEICKAIAEHNLTRQWDATGLCPYAYSGDQWVGYEDEESIYHKARLIETENYGGAVVYTIDLDDFVGRCGRKHNLLKTVQSSLNPANVTVHVPVSAAHNVASKLPLALSYRFANYHGGATNGSNVTHPAARRNQTNIYQAPTYKGDKCINGMCITAGSTVPTLSVFVTVFAAVLFSRL